MTEDILLVHLPDTPLDGSREVFTPPLGLWSMRSNSVGKKVQVVDFGISLDEYWVDVVGYSLQFPAHVAQLAQMEYKIHAEKKFLGGPTGSTLDWPGFTSISGDGESWLAGVPVKFSDLRPPHFQTSEMEEYWKRAAPFSGFASGLRWMPVETSRGCPNACGFCKIPSLWGRWQARPLRVLDEYFSYLVSEHDVQEILIVDDNVAASIPRFLDIMALFKKHHLKWSVVNGIYNRALLNVDVRRALLDGESGCLYMSLPFEAGNARSAALMSLGKKFLNHDEAACISASLRAAGIATAGQFIIGYPGETEEDVRATLAYANSLPLSQRHIHLATPLPGTPMHEVCVANNYLVGAVADATYKTPIVETPMLSRERLYALWLADRKEHT